MRFDPVVRPAEPGDEASIAAFALEAWLHTYAQDGIRQAIAEYVLRVFTPDRFRVVIEDYAHSVLVAEIDDRLLGYAVLHFGAQCPSERRQDVELSALLVQAHFLRRGIGSRLLRVCTEVARARDPARGIWVAVNHNHAAALAFYRRHGFVQIGTTRFVLGKESHDQDVLLREHA